MSNWLAQSGSQLGDRWGRLVGPFEATIGWLGDLFFGAFDSFDILESRVIRAVTVIFWPLVAAAKLVGRCLPQSITNGAPVQWIGVSLGRLFGGVLWLTEKLNLDSVVLFLVWLIQPLWRPLAALLSFANAWLSTRSLRELTLAVPALILLAPFCYVAVEGAKQSQEEIAGRYKLAVRDALEAGDSQRIFLFERKLAQLGVDTRRSEYRDAVALAEDGDVKTAYQRMKRLAPLDRPGYLQAHVWIALRMLTRELTDKHEPLLTEQSNTPANEASVKLFELVEQHLAHISAVGGTGEYLIKLRAHALAGKGRIADAAEEIADVAKTDRLAAMQRLQWLLACEEKEAARQQAVDLLEMYSQLRASAPLTVDDHKSRAVAADLVGDDVLLETVLADWQAAAPDSVAPNKLLVGLRGRQVDQLLATQTANVSAVVERLCETADLGASRAWLMSRLGAIVDRRVRLRNVDLTWQGLLKTPRANPTLREAIGATAATRGQIVSARSMLGGLVEEGQDNPILLNNYAWTLAQQPTPDAEKALRIVDRALQQRPDEHRFRETRGQILIRLERWREAIQELEFALNKMPTSTDIHRSLAAAYEAVSQPQLAERHRERAR